MDGVKLSQEYRATIRRQFSFIFKSLGVPGTHFIDLERIKAESTLKPLTGFEPKTPWFGIRHPNHYATASALDPKVLRSNPNYMVDQALKPNLMSRLSVTFGL